MIDTNLASRGRVVAISGVLVRARMPLARIGELCVLRDPRSGERLRALVIGLDGEEVILSPVGDMRGLSIHTEVVATGAPPMLEVGASLLGQVIDPFGRHLSPAPQVPAFVADENAREYPLHASPPDAMRRRSAHQRFTTGVRSIDGLLTLAQGQRVGLFGSAGVGKSSLVLSLIEHADAEVVVLALVGERGREVRELLEERMDESVRQRVVAVVATSDRPAAERAMAADAATTIAEFFRDQGKHVLLVVDSLTRYARALRELGLAAGEPPTRRGYPPSFFAALPRLLERAGCDAGPGAITGLYTVLTEGDAALDPVAEEVTSILDGHIVLSEQLARRNHFPAIDILRSRSRLMDAVTDAQHRRLASEVREALGRLEDTDLLRQVGEYVAGVDGVTDRAIAAEAPMTRFLRQEAAFAESFDQTTVALQGLLP
jgi:ATP synthase in type III secretion protein N